MDQEVNLHASLEAEMRDLANEIKPLPQAEQREALKTAVKDRAKTPTQLSAPAPAQSTVPSEPSSVLPAYAKDAPKDVQLSAEKLVDIAWHQGLGAAASAAKNAGPLAADLFHDALAGKMYEEMQKRGLL